MAGQDVFVVGAANSAGQAAVHLARYAAHVALARARRVPGPGDVGLPDHTAHCDPHVEVKLHTQIADAPRRCPLGDPDAEDTVSGEPRVPARRGGLHHDRGRAPHRMAPQPHLPLDKRGLSSPPRSAPAGVAAHSARRLPFETSLPGVFAVGRRAPRLHQTRRGRQWEKGRSRWARFTSTWPSRAVEMRRQSGTPKRNRLQLGRQVRAGDQGVPQGADGRASSSDAGFGIYAGLPLACRMASDEIRLLQ